MSRIPPIPLDAERFSEFLDARRRLDDQKQLSFLLGRMLQLPMIAASPHNDPAITMQLFQ
jgi:hypothetical protein